MRRLADVALPTYIASTEASRDMVCTINLRHNGDRPARLASAIEVFTTNQCPNVDHDLGLSQRTLDEAVSKRRLNDVLARANQSD